MCIHSYSQDNTGSYYISESQDYHDFNKHLFQKAYIFTLEETRPEKSSRWTILNFDPHQEYYYIKRTEEDLIKEYIFNKDSISIFLNGNTVHDSSLIAKHKLTPERAMLLKDYYIYLWYLPMNLNGPEAEIQNKIIKKNYGSEKLVEVSVNYPNSENNHSWFFYFHPQKYQLRRSMFYKSEYADGEYIVYEGEYQFDGIRIPALRKWYTNAEDKFLGEDKLIEIRLGRIK